MKYVKTDDAAYDGKKARRWWVIDESGQFPTLTAKTCINDVKLQHMTPKEKAKELVDKFIVHTRVYHEVLGWEDYIESAKQCALIAVDEIISFLSDDPYYKDYDYFHQVKTEIEKL